ncbi:hypothetical protein C2845_PM08G26850 [Panicum miliaceum]|uniref:Uncharacterized protein n=1 Tax=Panicum miliaceum TaxID=4540 RepID=A0A3L6R2Z2_PANMI|nr:hypothetical protein C2845_PM08G26850 [Panicum miliaceum]
MKADDDDACGRGRRGCCSAVCSLLSAENERFFVPIWTAITAAVAVLSVLAILLIVGMPYREPSYSVDLTGYDGIDAGRAARIVSPAFNVTLRMNDTCVDSARVAVTYSGVALGWARAEPRDCAEGRWGEDVEVVARGGGWGCRSASATAWHLTGARARWSSMLA